MFGILIVGYLFLGGAAAGACFVTALLALLSPASLVAKRVVRRRGGSRFVVCPPKAYRQLLAPGFAVGLVALVLGVACLLADVGRVDEAALLLVSPPVTYLAVGTWALIVCAGLSVICVVVWSGVVRLSLAAMRVIEGALMLASLVVMAYTGLLLYSMPSVPVWFTPWLPVLFVLSALSCGSALVLAVGQFSGAAHLFVATFKRIAAADAAVIVVEMLVVALYLAAVLGVAVPGAPAFPPASGTAEALTASAQTLVAGPFAWLFWGVFAAAGLVVALVLDLVLVRSANANALAALASAACILAGGFAVRFCVIEAGLHPVLQSILM